MLYSRNGYHDSRVIEGARVIDPAEGIDAALTVTVEDGVITRLEPGEVRNGYVLAPAFVDPHVHLRTPGREDEETIASGTEAAAAGGYCVILAMPNTEPVVDSAAVLASLIERARTDAVVPVGFLAAISKGQEGSELTEMGELADAGAAGFTDDGRPVRSPGLMRRALQYSPVAGRRIAVHCEEPTLTRGGHMHEGVVSAELGLTGYPSVGESTMVERDLSLAGYEHRPVHLMHLSARESVEALSRAQVAGVEATAEVTPHHLCLTDESVRSLDPNLKMNPPLRSADDRAALVAGLRDGTIACVATDHAPHARHEKDVPFEEAPFGVTGLETAFAALNTHLVGPGLLTLPTLLERMSAGPARAFGLEAPRIAVGAPANLVLLDTESAWRVTEDGFRSRSVNSWLLGQTLKGRVKMTVAAGRVVFEG
jgi:dihydroorotase